MHRSLLLAILFFAISIVLGCCNYAYSQAVLKEVPFQVSVHHEQIDKNQSAYTLSWAVPSKGRYALRFHADADTGVFYALRICPQGVVSLGYSKDLITLMVNKGYRIHYSNEIDYAKPFVIKETGQQTIVFQSNSKATEYLFAVLNTLYRKRLLPISQGREAQEVPLTPAEIGNALMFNCPQEWTWFQQENQLIG
jgi:hypothetical protein